MKWKARKYKSRKAECPCCRRSEYIHGGTRVWKCKCGSEWLVAWKYSELVYYKRTPENEKLYQERFGGIYV